MSLKDEILNDPTSKGYATYLPDAPGKVVELLNAQTETMLGELSADRAITWSASGPMATITDASTNPAHVARASCLAFLHSLSSRMPIDMASDEIKKLFAGWVAAGVITQAQSDDAFARAQWPASRAEVLGLGVVTEADLRAALGA